MAAGLGFKTFTTGEVLTAADTNGYLMQGVLVFADATARDAAITSPQEGQFAYLKDTNVTTYYTGSAWANLDTTGMTNPMTTTGDTIYSSSGSTPARLGIGSSGQILTVSGGVPTWAAAPSGSLNIQQIATGTMSGTSFNISGLTQDYIQIVFAPVNWNTGNGQFRIRLNGDSSAVYAQASGSHTIQTPPVTYTTFGTTNSEIRMQGNNTGITGDTISVYVLTLTNCKASGFTNFYWTAGFQNNIPSNSYVSGSGIYKTAAQITSINATVSGGQAFQGASSYTVYGA
jgi:hypothetical protein